MTTSIISVNSTTSKVQVGGVDAFSFTTSAMTIPSLVTSAINSTPIGATTPSTGAFTTLSASATGEMLSNTGATTSGKYLRFANTGTNFYAGIESSTGGTIITGTSAYSGSVASGNGLNFSGNAGTTLHATLDTSGNLGLGVTPSAWGSAYKSIQLGVWGSIGSASAITTVSTNWYTDNANDRYINTGVATRYYQNAGQHVWQNAISGTAGGVITGVSAMTLDASGRLAVGSSSVNAVNTSFNNYIGSGQVWGFGTNSASAGANFYVLNTAGSGVYLVSGNTAWTATSDERFKDIIEPISGAVEKTKALRSVIGKYKTDPDGTRRSFLIAQDVQAVFPEAVDASDASKLGVQYTDVIPLLVAAIKEQQALIESLTARLAAAGL